MRYQLVGQREIIVIPFDGLYDYCGLAGIDKKEGTSFIDYMNDDVLASLNSDAALTKYHESGAKMYHAVVEPDSLLYVPMGSWVVERALGTAHVCGFRTSLLEPSPKAFDCWRRLLEAYKSVQTDGDALTVFWNHLDEFMKEAASKVDGADVKAKKPAAPE